MCTLRGTVIEVHQELLYYEIQKIRVFLNCNDENPPLLPLIGTHVELSHCKCLPQKNLTVAICSMTEVKYEKASPLLNAMGLRLWSLLKYRANGVADAFLIDEFIQQISMNLGCSDYILGCCLLHIFRLNEMSSTSMEIQLSFSNNLRYVNKNSKLYSEMFNITEASTCLQGYYPNLRNNYLLGILTVDALYGWFVIGDEKHNIPVIFRENKIPSVTCKALVIFDSWIVFTEAFFQPSSENQEFILMDENNMHIVHFFEEPPEKYYVPMELKFEPSASPDLLIDTKIQVFRRSMPIIGYSKKPQVWLEVFILKDESKTPAFFILDDRLFPAAAYIQENHTYLLKHNKCLETCIVKNEIPELKKLKANNNKAFLLSPETVFYKLENEEPIGTVIEFDCLKSLKKFITSGSNNDVILSFIAPISKKSVKKLLFKQHIPKRHKLTKYGNPGMGTQIHLTFTFYNDLIKNFVDVYLAEENSVGPLGLLQNMMVKVNHVMVSSNKYLKSTTFTNFQLMGFRADTFYRSISLNIANKEMWSCVQQEFLSPLEDCELVTPNTVIAGLVQIFKVLELQTKSICRTCRNENLGICKKCNSTDLDLDVWCRLLVNGINKVSSQFKLSSCDISVLNVIFRLRTLEEFQSFYKAFLKCGGFNFKSDSVTYEIDMERNLDDRMQFIKDMTDYLIGFNNDYLNEQLLVEMVCMKNEKYSKTRGHLESWHAFHFKVLE